tara:strand:- start:357 stop:719 length:363 start_codon:yes stop_codon:yes gene_type:complete
MAFKLKSGNTPLFKKMGATPAKDMKTGSYKHEFENNSKRTPVYDEGDDDNGDDDNGDGVPAWKKAVAGIGTVLTGGLDAVYGTGKVKMGPKGVIFSDGDKGKCKDGTNTVTGEACEEKSK